MSLKRHFVFLEKLTVRFVEHDRTWRTLERALAWVRGEAVLCIAAICAIASMIVVPPDSGYGSYFDTRVLILLFCLMATVAGLRQAGLFDVLARVLLQGNRSFYQVLAALIMLPFFAMCLLAVVRVLDPLVLLGIVVAVLLSEFTTDWQGLLLGVDIGGLGTPIASLASLIALRLYVRAQPSGLLRFMKVFTLVNVVGIAAMFGLYACLNL